MKLALAWKPGEAERFDRAREALAEWYAPRREAFPWRRRRPDPYRVLVSEVMLQQTQVSRVVSSYVHFVERFPTVRALATAPRGAVLRAWGTLGYNRRALALAEAARIIVRDHAGKVPADPATLRRLPGIGPYTASAIASIGHGLPIPAVDTNVRRVVVRFVLGRDPGRVGEAEVRDAARRAIDRVRPGDWNQAVMDLGREVCRSDPRCDACPLRAWCAWRVGPADRRLADGRAGNGPTGGGRSRPGVRPSASDPYRGSFRAVRGAVLRALRTSTRVTLDEVAHGASEPLERVVRAVRALHAEGLVLADARALAGRGEGRLRLPD